MKAYKAVRRTSHGVEHLAVVRDWHRDRRGRMMTPRRQHKDRMGRDRETREFRRAVRPEFTRTMHSLGRMLGQHRDVGEFTIDHATDRCC